MTERLPSFFVTGVTKAGTTSIYDALEQHPDVFVPHHKEPRYYAFRGHRIDPDDVFTRNVITDRGEYLALYKGAAPHQRMGDCSLYLNYPQAAAAIANEVPDARLISVFRDPVERAYSHYLFEVHRGIFPASVSFEALVRGEPVRVAGKDRKRDHAYVDAGLYAAMLEPWLTLFPREQHLLMLFEDLASDPQAVTGQVYRHIGVDPAAAQPRMVRRAASGLPKNQALHKAMVVARKASGLARAVLPRDMLEELRRVQAQVTNRNLYKPKLPPEVRERLLPLFREDTLRFQDIIGRDLSAWLSVEQARAA